MNRTGCWALSDEQVPTRDEASRWQQQGQMRAQTNEPGAAALALYVVPFQFFFQKSVDFFSELHSLRQTAHICCNDAGKEQS